MANAGNLDAGLAVRALSLPDEFIEHDSQAGQLADCGLDRDGIVAALSALVGAARKRAAPQSGKNRSFKSVGQLLALMIAELCWVMFW